MSTALMNWLARLCVIGASLLVLGAAATWLMHRSWFDLERIELRGDLTHVSSAAIRASIAGRISGNFFTAKLEEVRRAFEAVPWVAAASVRRVWPNRLVVTLREHRALGLWSDGRLLSDAGRLFAANLAEAEMYGPLAQFDGPEMFAGEAVRRYYELAARLAPLSLGVSGVEISERASWAMTTDAGQRFELGRDEPAGRLSERIVLLVAAYPRVSAQLGAPPRRIDLRYPNGLAAAGGKGSSTARKS
ncbi:MAG TPA: FtsQ-type POTRA domain-containing protein [Burkholderiaceae bacterium]|jgi:cell division protein FtsQ|nr:FtsQ-type POTRA domain-containing protein [Burkholderiaceae bacterium]